VPEGSSQRAVGALQVIVYGLIPSANPEDFSGDHRHHHGPHVSMVSLKVGVLLWRQLAEIAGQSIPFAERGFHLR
jgi:hypothetical protein